MSQISCCFGMFGVFFLVRFVAQNCDGQILGQLNAVLLVKLFVNLL